MADGTTHDRLIWLTSPLAVLLSQAVLPEATPVFTVSYLVGGLMLSPDLDTPSKPFHRWRGLKGFWLPYQQLFKHRGASHWIAIGTLSRVLYLLSPLIVLGGIAGVDLVALTIDYWRWAVVVFAGIELSAWTHLAADGLLFK